MTTVAGREVDRLPGSASPFSATGAAAVLALVALDVGAVPAALPSVRVDLGSSSSGLVWVQDGYLLALAVGLVALRQVRVDGRLLVPTGVALLAAGAVLASYADSTSTLVTGRVLQGAGSSVLLAPALESLRAAGGGRPRMWTVLGAAALLGLALAPLIGGGIAEAAHWRWLFRLEAVAALPALLLATTGRLAAPRGLAAPRVPAAPRGPAAPAAFAGALVCGVTGLVQSGPWGWASADTLLLLAGGAALFVLAWRDALDSGRAVALTLAGCLSTALLLMPQYLDLVRGLSPLRCGVLTLTLTLPAATCGVAAALLPGRPPRRLLLAGGLACAAGGALGMTRIDPASSYALVVVSMALLGSGIGTAAGALARGARASAAELAPAAAAGAALVVAASGALLQRAQLDERASGGSFEDALAAGVAASGWLMAALLAAAAVLAWRRASPGS